MQSQGSGCRVVHQFKMPCRAGGRPGDKEGIGWVGGCRGNGMQGALDSSIKNSRVYGDCRVTSE